LSLISFVIDSMNLNTFADGTPVILSVESSTPKTIDPLLPLAKAIVFFFDNSLNKASSLERYKDESGSWKSL